MNIMRERNHLHLKQPCWAGRRDWRRFRAFSAQGKSQSWEQSKSKGEESGYGQVVALPCLCGSFFLGTAKVFFPVMMFFLKIGWEFQDVSALVCKCRLD